MEIHQNEKTSLKQNSKDRKSKNLETPADTRNCRGMEIWLQAADSHVALLYFYSINRKVFSIYFLK